MGIYFLLFHFLYGFIIEARPDLLHRVQRKMVLSSVPFYFLSLAYFSGKRFFVNLLFSLFSSISIVDFIV